MDIILLQQIAKLGAVGDVVTVKNGYARNFLLPKKMAIRASKQNLQEFEKMREIHEKNDAVKRNQAEAVEKQIKKQDLIFIRQAGDAGQLYGSVSTRDIAAAIEEKGFKITRSQVILNNPIKIIGLHTIRINLHAGLQTDIQINVARSEEEAKKQKKGEIFTEQNKTEPEHNQTKETKDNKTPKQKANQDSDHQEEADHQKAKQETNQQNTNNADHNEQGTETEK